MTCPDCAEARVRYHGRYHTSCDGCMARAIARSLAAWHALDSRGSGNREDLRELIQRSFPEQRRQRARAEVWQWWQQDHGQLQEAAA